MWTAICLTAVCAGIVGFMIGLFISTWAETDQASDTEARGIWTIDDRAYKITRITASEPVI